MIDAKQAVLTAKSKAEEILGARRTTLEEIERDSHRGREVWSITLGLPGDPVIDPLLDPILGGPTLASRLYPGEPAQYKRFLIDVETGELLAMKLREVALP